MITLSHWNQLLTPIKSKLETGFLVLPDGAIVITNLDSVDMMTLLELADKNKQTIYAKLELLEDIRLRRYGFHPTVDGLASRLPNTMMAYKFVGSRARKMVSLASPWLGFHTCEYVPGVKTFPKVDGSKLFVCTAMGCVSERFSGGPLWECVVPIAERLQVHKFIPEGTELVEFWKNWVPVDDPNQEEILMVDWVMLTRKVRDLERSIVAEDS